jgi:hypothetical protein
MRPRTCLLALVVVASAFGSVIILRDAPVRAHDEGGARVFELRTYHCHPGRLDALHTRFRDHTNYLFVKHGMSLIGYWTPADKEDTLVYVVAFASAEAREAAWNGFRNDPAWQKARAESEKAGPIVDKVESQLLAATDYSPIR